MSNAELLQNAIQAYNDELVTYNLKPNKSNSTKTRNALMVVNKLTKLCRGDILTAQKALPTKPRIKKSETVPEEVVEPVEIVEPVIKVKKTRVKKI